MRLFFYDEHLLNEPVAHLASLHPEENCQLGSMALVYASSRPAMASAVISATNRGRVDAHKDFRGMGGRILPPDRHAVPGGNPLRSRKKGGGTSDEQTAEIRGRSRGAWARPLARYARFWSSPRSAVSSTTLAAVTLPGTQPKMLYRLGFDNLSPLDYRDNLDGAR